jgi:hypothetical protein
MNQRDIHALAQSLRHRIGRHYRMVGHHRSHDEYLIARRDSDEAESLAKYLIMHLADRHDAKRLADWAGMPGYINMR